MPTTNTSSPRRTHRKRFSALHLSSDTTISLPEYHQSIAPWPRNTQDSSFGPDIPSDKPPDYPDSAEEADEDTDSEDRRSTLLAQQSLGSSALLHTPQSTSTSSPRRKQRFQHRRKYSTPVFGYNETSQDPYLDSLLERSVHALEMSNTLLQSSMTAQTSSSAVFSYDSPKATKSEFQFASLSSKNNGGPDNKASWIDDMEEVRKRVDSLFGDGKDLSGNVSAEHAVNDWRRRMNSSQSSNSEAGLSNSLPASASPLQQYSQRLPRRRPSLDLREAGVEAGGLRLSHRTREDLVAPPPRAVTVYIESDADPAIITMPSTLGLRSSTSVPLNADWNSSTASLLSSPAKPVVTDTPLPSSSTPAYEKLVSFVKRPSNSAGATPSSSFKSSFMIPRRNSAAGTSDRGRRGRSPQPRSENTRSRSHTITSPSSPCHHHRRMTPPVEESSSSSDDCIAKQTISSLRKILDEQPAHEDTKRKSAPIALTVPAPVSGTSNATASISRMLTKKLHHSSTRPPSPPRQSAMKGSRPSTPQHAVTPTLSPLVPPAPNSSSTPSPVVSELGSLSSLITNKITSTPTSSGLSTPKRISFAELPEAHISSRPDKFRDKGRRKGRKNKPTKMKGIHVDNDENNDGVGWLAALFGLNPNAGPAYSSTSREERMEDRITRSWGGRCGSGYGSIDEWAV